MEVKAIAKYIRISPNKVRRVINLIRGKSTTEAFHILKFLPHKAATLVEKVLHSAVANAEHNNKLDTGELVVSKVTVDKGPSLRRFRARARGRVNSIEKPTSHITVAVTEGVRHGTKG